MTTKTVFTAQYGTSLVEQLHYIK